LEHWRAGHASFLLVGVSVRTAASTPAWPDPRGSAHRSMHSGAPGELSGGAALRVSTSLDRDGQLRVERVAPVVVQADEVDAGRQLGAQVRVTPLTGAVVAVVDLVHLPRRGEQPEHPVTVGGHRV